MADRPKRRFAWGSALLLVGVAAVGAAFLLRPEPPLDVETLRIERGAVREVVPSAASGEVLPARRVVVRAEMAGTVESVRKRAGDRVEAGELVVAFASAELDARKSQARSNIDAAKVAVEIAKTRFETVERAHERAKKLRARGAVSPVDLERSDTERRAAEHGVRQAEAALGQVKAALRLANIMAERTQVEAPFAGVLQEVFAELGTQATPATPLFDLIDDSSVRIQVPVDEADIARVSLEQRVFLRTGSRRDRELSGKVVLIPPAVGKANGAAMANPLQERERAFYVEIVPDDPSQFFVGASVAAEFLVSERDDVLYVPTHLVMGTGLERAVFRVDGKRAARVKFKAGLTSWERTEVVSGLEHGDQIVSTLNKRGLEDGVRVEARLTADEARAAAK